MLLELNKEQQKAFNRLKKAYQDCKKLNVELINQYGTIYGYDGKLIVDLGDDEIKPNAPHVVYYDEVMEKFKYNSNSIDNVDPGRADDPVSWMFGLTEKGFKIFQMEDFD